MEYYNKEGKRIDTLEWAKLFGDGRYKVVEQTRIGKYLISTVWLGLNHNRGEGSPLIFETMAFPGDKQERYATLAEAQGGHKRWCDEYTNKKDDFIFELEIYRDGFIRDDAFGDMERAPEYQVIQDCIDAVEAKFDGKEAV